jgi:hypothetical protein
MAWDYNAVIKEKRNEGDSVNQFGQKPVFDEGKHY